MINTPAFLIANDHVLNIIRTYGTARAKKDGYFLHLSLPDNELHFVLYGDGRQVVSMNVVINGVKHMVFEEIVIHSETWLKLLEQKYPALEVAA